MTAPVPALTADRDGNTRVRLGVGRMTPLEARQLAFELFEIADLADHANGVTPTAGTFVPANAETIDDDGEAAR